VRRIAGMHADISALKEVESSAQSLEVRYRMLYEAAPVALIMWSPRGHVIEWNHQAESLFGWSNAQVQGKRMAEQLVAENGREIYADMARLAVAENRVIESVTDCRTQAGEDIRCRWWSLPLRQKGALVGLMTLALDITEQFHNEQQLERYRNDLEERVARRTAELAHARDALAQIIDKSPIPTFVLDENHCVTHWNQACERILGTPASWVIGTANQWQAFYPESRPVLADLVMFNDHVTIDSLYGGKVRPSSVVPGAFESEDYFPLLGRWLFFTASAVRDANGQVIGAIETLQDISDQKQAEMALQEAKADAEAAARVKAEFLANMSHEIRTPLNAIVGFAHLLHKTELNARQASHVQHLRASGDMLLQLINDILDFSKIEAGRMPIEKVPFVLDTVLDNLSGMIAERAREKGLELHFVLANEVPQHLVGDSLRLTQVLVNLLSNAIKFTEAGQILIFISVAERSDAKVRLEIAVQDSGIGISPEQQARLFRAFSQADSSTTRKYGGTGLGLTICDRLVTLMGGRISLSSELGVGTTFLFDVPLGIDQTVQSASISKINQRVLVVDDNAIARTVNGQLLEKLGYTVDLADSGSTALQRVAESGNDPYRMVFLDWNMPGMSGVEVARRLRAEAHPIPRIVVVTSAGQNEAEAAFAGAEVSALVLKPVSATSLAAAIAEMDSSPARMQAAEVPALLRRLPGLRVLLVDDVSTNRLVASEILIDEGAIVAEAENGREAVDKVMNGGPWDVVLMDVQMPEMNGLDATRMIRADARFTKLKILAMTAFALDEEKERCLAAGMDGFLTKPIEPETVISTLAGIAEQHARNTPATTVGR
jgi:PAS domain S-box-containing protein